MSPFTTFKNNPPMDSLKLLITAGDEMEMNIIRDILENNEIPVFVRYRDSSSTAKIYAGYSIFGADIFVDEGDFEKADELLKACRSEETEEEEISEEELAKEALAAGTPEETKGNSMGLLLPVAAALLIIGLIGIFFISRL